MLSRQIKGHFTEIIEVIWQFFFSYLLKAEDGLQGVRCVEESIASNKPIDLIFMDNVMPNLTGPCATRLIRENCCFRGKIIALTGSVLDDDVNEFRSSGVDNVIAKPMQQGDLERILSGTSATYLQLLSL